MSAHQSAVSHMILSVPVERFGRSIQAASLGITGVALSVSLNLVVTFLILLRLAVTWRRTAEALPDRKRPRMYADITGILIESAAPLALFGLCTIVTTAIYQLHAPATLAERGRVGALMLYFSVIYYSF
jgi:hypothetical protein